MILLQERRISLTRDLRFTDFPELSRELFVIRVDRKSNVNSRLVLVDIKNLIKPLSSKWLHLERFRWCKEIMYLELARADRESFVMSVQLRSRVYRFLTVGLFSS